MTTARTDHRAALEGVKVVEFSDYEGVHYCGRTLAALGADVVKLELPAGDPLRRRPPLAPSSTGEGPKISLAFEYLNGGKRSVVADLDTDEGRRLAARLVEWGDVVLVSPEHRDVLGLDAIPRRPGQVRALAGAYGGRSVEEAPTTAFTRLHASTSGYLMPADKDTSVRPGWGGPYVFESMFGTALAVAVLAELQRRTGGEIDYSYQGYGVWMDKMMFPRVSRSTSFDLHRNTNAYPFGGSMACTDGFACIFVIEEHQWHSLCRQLGRTEWLDDPRFANGVVRLAVQEEIDAVLAAWCAERTVDEVLALGRAADFPVGRVRRPSEVLSWPQLQTRGFVADGDTAFGRVPMANLPFGPGLPAVTASPAPTLGEHSTTIAAELGSPESERPRATPRSADATAQWRGPAEGADRPYAGLRVLDFTWAAAGPIATSILAYLGADIAKVELRSRPDLMRMAERQYGYSEDDDLDSSPSFHEIAAGKRSIELDLREPEDREIALRLAAVADVVIENMRPGKIEQLSLSYEAVSAINPGVVMCSQSATARVEGPGIPGYAPIFWAEGGGGWLTGWPHRRPGVVRGPVDFHAAAFACLGVMALLEQRRHTGVGGYVDTSAIETVSAAFGVELLEQAVTGRDGVRRGNEFPGALFNDVFPCHGVDQWIAITARDETEAAALFTALGLPAGSAPTSRMSAEERASCYDAVAAVTARSDASRLEGRLGAVGVPAARSLSLRASLTDARLAHRGIWQPVHHNVLGEQVIVGLPWTFDGRPYDMHAPGPALGEHSALIRKEWLGE